MLFRSLAQPADPAQAQRLAREAVAQITPPGASLRERRLLAAARRLE